MPTFDGINLLIILDPGTTTVDIQADLYEPWKDWMLESPINRGYPQAFRSDGGGTLTSIINQGSYFFLQNQNGWRIRAAEEDATIYMVGNLAAEDPDLALLVNTVGNYNVMFAGLQPVTQGVTPVMAQQLEYASFGGGVTVDVLGGYPGTGLFGDNPIGSQLTPSNNIPDAMTIAYTRGFSRLFIIGNITLDTGDDISDFLIIGQDQILSTITINDGADVTNSKFENCNITGVLDGGNIIQRSRIKDINYVNGYIWECLIEPGTITLGGSSAAHIMDCWSGQPGLGTPIIDMGGSGQSLGLRGYNGGMKLINKTGPDAISIDLSSGQVILDSTIIDGEIVIRGSGQLTDNSTGTATIHSDGLMSKDTIAAAVSEEIGAEIQYATFDGNVTIDTVSGAAGTTYPIGTPILPSNNLADAQNIAAIRGLNSFRVIGTLTLSSGDDISAQNFIGTDKDASHLILESGCITWGANLFDMTVTGTCGGRMNITGCHLYDIIGLCASGGDANIASTHLMGSIQINTIADQSFQFNDCIGSSINPPVLDCNNSPASLHNTDFTGSMEFSNITNSLMKIFVDCDPGDITLLDTCSAGEITIRGVGILYDYTNGTAIVNSDGLISKVTITSTVWDEPIVDHLGAGSTGEKLNTASSGGVDLNAMADAVWNHVDGTQNTTTIEFLKDIEGGRWIIDDTTNEMVFYKADNVTEVMRFDLKDKDGLPTSEGPYERVRQ